MKPLSDINCSLKFLLIKEKINQVKSSTASVFAFCGDGWWILHWLLVIFNWAFWIGHS